MDKTKIQLVMAFLLMSAFVPMMSYPHGPETHSQQDSQNFKDLRRLTKEKPSKRHRIPSREYLEYFYDGNGITITTPGKYTQIEIYIMEENGISEISGTLSVENGYYIETGTLYGSYTITCTTEDGSIFSGTMTN